MLADRRPVKRRRRAGSVAAADLEAGELPLASTKRADDDDAETITRDVGSSGSPGVVAARAAARPSVAWRIDR